MRNKKSIICSTGSYDCSTLCCAHVYHQSAWSRISTIQVRFSEALCILPVFTPAAIPGLFIGCLISNLITGGIIWDIIFGSIATLLGALGTYFLRKKKFVYTLPPVIANIIIVPLVLRYGYGFTTVYKGVDISLVFNAVTVGIGEIISICVLGSLLKGILRNTEM